MSTDRLPKSLIDAIRYFSNVDEVTEFVAQKRWNGAPVCDRCGGTDHYFLSTRRIWKCKNKECGRQFSVKVGTTFEDSPLGLDKWLPAVWLIANSKNGISSHELGRALDITQTSAWFMLHRISLAMQSGSFEKIDGIAEVDETFVGGLAKNMHESEKVRRITGTGGKDKTIVIGALERGGNVHAEVVPDRTADTVQSFVRKTVEPGSSVFTDALAGYRGLASDYDHRYVDHRFYYVDGIVSSNGIENFWNLLNRSIRGTYVHIDPAHLVRYVNERAFAFNN